MPGCSSNHVHLLVTPERRDSAALLMKHLGQRYVQYINRTYRRSGTLWEGRFRSCLAQSEDYVLACYRYIELNPVRAGMVGHPRDYRWSSHIANLGEQKEPLLTPHAQYLRLGDSDAARIAAYERLFEAHLDPDTLGKIRNAANGNYALGGVRFQQEIAGMLQRRVTRGRAGRPAKEEKQPDTQQILE